MTTYNTITDLVSDPLEGVEVTEEDLAERESVFKDLEERLYKEEYDNVLLSRCGEGGYVVKDVDELRDFWEERKET